MRECPYSEKELLQIFLRGHKHFASEYLEDFMRFLRFLEIPIGYADILDNRNQQVPSTLYAFNFRILARTLKISNYQLHTLISEIHLEKYHGSKT